MFWKKIIYIYKKNKNRITLPRPNRPSGDCYEFSTAIPFNEILTCGVPSLSIKGTRWSGAYLASRRFMRTSKRSPSVKRAANSEMRGGSGDPQFPPSLLRAAPQQPSNETLDQWAKPTANEGTSDAEKGGMRDCSLSSSLITRVQKHVPVTDHSCWDGHFMLSFSKEAAKRL